MTTADEYRAQAVQLLTELIDEQDAHRASPQYTGATCGPSAALVERARECLDALEMRERIDRYEDAMRPQG